tara:strand:+ start:796 stop:1068 length:273 start_codon:yes stop_codon:yes gene_type:complete
MKEKIKAYLRKQAEISYSDEALKGIKDQWDHLNPSDRAALLGAGAAGAVGGWYKGMPGLVGGAAFGGAAGNYLARNGLGGMSRDIQGLWQ